MMGNANGDNTEGRGTQKVGGDSVTPMCMPILSTKHVAEMAAESEGKEVLPESVTWAVPCEQHRYEHICI